MTIVKRFQMTIAKRKGQLRKGAAQSKEDNWEECGGQSESPGKLCVFFHRDYPNRRIEIEQSAANNDRELAKGNQNGQGRLEWAMRSC